MTTRSLRLAAAALLLLFALFVALAGGQAAGNCSVNNNDDTGWVYVIAAVGGATMAATVLGLRMRLLVRLPLALSLGLVAAGASWFWAIASWAGNCAG